MKSEEDELKQEKLEYKSRLLEGQLQDLSTKIDKLENSHLSRWEGGNLYLSFDP
jgi:hypothetical protein